MHSALILFAIFAGGPVTLTGSITNVPDGDVIAVLVDESEIKVRLEGIAAHELRQPFGTKAR